jgi:hypothetical protein
MEIPLDLRDWHSRKAWPMLASRHQRRQYGQVAGNQAQQWWMLHPDSPTINEITVLRTIKNYRLDSLTYAMASDVPNTIFRSEILYLYRMYCCCLL